MASLLIRSGHRCKQVSFQEIDGNHQPRMLLFGCNSVHKAKLQGREDTVRWLGCGQDFSGVQEILKDINAQYFC